MSTCPKCGGYGKADCPKCYGSGREFPLNVSASRGLNCFTCKGYGVIVCTACEGLGEVKSSSGSGHDGQMVSPLEGGSSPATNSGQEIKKS
jgi:DnaJ-class molecular chaperone